MGRRANKGGTTDGQGDLNFIQGITKGDKLWDSVKGLLGPPSAEQKVPSPFFISSTILRCNQYQAEHAPKPILLNTGEYKIPFQWHPVHIDTQVALFTTSLSPTTCFHSMEKSGQLAWKKSTVGEAQRFQMVMTKEGFYPEICHLYF